MNNKIFDVFISHASEDKEIFVRPLAKALAALGYQVWFDEFTMTVGDGLRSSIDKGISNSRFGVVILSPSFFEKGWANYELDGLVNIDVENLGESIILPIWYKISKKEVENYSNSLANKVAIVTNGEKIDQVTQELVKKIGDYFYTIDKKGKITRSNEKISIDYSKREKKFQFISNSISHRIFTKDKSIITSDSIVYPYSKKLSSLRFNHWQQNRGKIQLVRHVVYDLETGEQINTNNEILENDGNEFSSRVEFKRSTLGPVRVVCEVKTTDLFKSVFQEGSDEIEIYHRVEIERNSFSLFLPDHEEFSKIECYVNGVKANYSEAPGGRNLYHEMPKNESDKTVFSFINK